MNPLLFVIVGLAALNLVQAWILDRQSKRHDSQVDRLTDKIMAPSLEAYKVSTITPAPAPAGNINKTQKAIPLADADPEEVMRAIAVDLGRSEN